MRVACLLLPALVSFSFLPALRAAPDPSEPSTDASTDMVVAQNQAAPADPTERKPRKRSLAAVKPTPPPEVPTPAPAKPSFLKRVFHPGSAAATPAPPSPPAPVEKIAAPAPRPHRARKRPTASSGATAEATHQKRKDASRDEGEPVTAASASAKEPDAPATAPEEPAPHSAPPAASASEKPEPPPAPEPKDEAAPAAVAAANTPPPASATHKKGPHGKPLPPPVPAPAPAKGPSKEHLAVERAVAGGDPSAIEKTKYEEAKARASEDPRIKELKQKADASENDSQGRAAMRAYNKALFEKMHAIGDKDVQDRIDRMEKAVLKDLGSE